jgi:8-oxo-dGTP pyrophosphatase MutT (NUDIX family)
MNSSTATTPEPERPAKPTPAIRQLATRTVYQNAWMTVREDTIRRPDGSTGIYGVIDKPDFALIIPLDNDGFHLVEQYRYPVAGRFWEFPQGTFPDRADGDPADLARAELAQETGLHAGQLTHLARLHNGYGMSSQGCNVFLATNLTPGPAQRDREEQDMRQRWVPRTSFEAMIQGSAITDTATIAAYTLLLLHERLTMTQTERQ